MPNNLAELILNKISIVEELYHRLILVVGPAGTGKTAALQLIAGQSGFEYLNINLELSRHLLDLTQRQRALQIQQILDDIVGRDHALPILLDNTEILFDVALRQDPLRLLQGVARHCTLVATWNGTLQGEYLTYARPEHPEYRRYPARDLVIVSTQADND
jgi:hypothetical protein